MSTIPQRLVLITGANSGIGFELAAQLLPKTNPTYHVFICARSPDKGHAALADLESRKLPGTAEFLHIEMRSDDLINRAVESVLKSHGKLDILVNNAAVSMPIGTLREQMNEAFDTNATGPLILTEAFAPLLKRGSNGRIINLSSAVGSIGRKLDPSGPMHKYRGEPYRASKTALHMITACQFVEYGQFGIKVFAYDPGFTVSNLSRYNTQQNGARDVAESVRPLIDVIEGKRDDEVGKFIHQTGNYPW